MGKKKKNMIMNTGKYIIERRSIIIRGRRNKKEKRKKKGKKEKIKNEDNE